jgi:repressor LexA
MNQTDKNDLQGYAFIRNRILHDGKTPSLREISDAVGYKSRHSAVKMLARLESRGLLKITRNGTRLSGQTPSMNERTVDVPLVGAVACGIPTLAEQNFEAIIPVSTKLATPGYKYFLLRAKGTSMNKSGINDGDLLLIRQQPVADDGEKVVALINDEATVKHIYHENGVIVLKPNSTDPEHKPIVLSDEFVVQGVVVATLPKNLY